MGWSGVDVSTPRLPEIVSEIDANPISFYSGSSVRECVFYVFFQISKNHDFTFFEISKSRKKSLAKV